MMLKWTPHSEPPPFQIRRDKNKQQLDNAVLEYNCNTSLEDGQCSKYHTIWIPGPKGFTTHHASFSDTTSTEPNEASW